jgi:hypothetical protein
MLPEEISPDLRIFKDGGCRSLHTSKRADETTGFALLEVQVESATDSRRRARVFFTSGFHSIDTGAMS